jgi:hypothetical protein
VRDQIFYYYYLQREAHDHNISISISNSTTTNTPTKHTAHETKCIPKYHVLAAGKGLVSIIPITHGSVYAQTPAIRTKASLNVSLAEPPSPSSRLTPGTSADARILVLCCRGYQSYLQCAHSLSLSISLGKNVEGGI